MCDDPPPEFEGNICEGVLVQVQMCKGNRPKCKSSNKVKGASKLSLPLGFYYRSAVTGGTLTPFKELTLSRELMPHEGKAND